MSNPVSDDPTFIEVGNGKDARRIALRMRDGAAPGLFWMSGFKSDMQGGKALALDAWAAEHKRACVRFDYSGHGESGGAFVDGTIGRWLEDSLAVFDAACQGPQVIIGSSMGGWMALLAARAMAEPPAGLVLIAPAADFTEELMWARFPEETKRTIIEHGVYLRPSQYSPHPTPITRRLIEEGRDHLLLGGPVSVGAPVHILQGMDDPDVPWRHALRLVECLAEDDVVVTLIKDGDHRLSREEDLARIVEAVDGIAPRR